MPNCDVLASPANILDSLSNTAALAQKRAWEAFFSGGDMSAPTEEALRDGGSVIRTALVKWHGLLQQDPITRNALPTASASSNPTERSSGAAGTSAAAAAPAGDSTSSSGQAVGSDHAAPDGCCRATAPALAVLGYKKASWHVRVSTPRATRRVIPWPDGAVGPPCAF